MKSLLKLTGLLVAGLVLVGKVHASAVSGMNVIEGSKHDFTLTYTGGGAGAISQCSTCHEMHKPVKMKPLWARNNPDKNLTWTVKSGILPTEYTNATFDADPIVASTASGSLIPTWAFADSRSGLCLSCHDGTQTVSDGGMITGRANLTIAPGDLSQNHRIGNERVQMVTNHMDLFIELLIIVQLALGCWVAYAYRWGSAWFASDLTPYLWSIFKLNPQITAVVDMPTAVFVHIVVAFVILALIPFSRLVHFLVAPFTYIGRPYQQVIWNWDRKRIRDPNTAWSDARPKNN